MLTGQHRLAIYLLCQEAHSIQGADEGGDLPFLSTAARKHQAKERTQPSLQNITFLKRKMHFLWSVIVLYMTPERRIRTPPAWRATMWKSPGKVQSKADLWRHYWHWDQAGETPQPSPEASFQPVNESCGLGILLQTQCAWTACPCRNLWQHFPVRDLGSGDPGFLLCHWDVTMRVGTGPRKTSSWTGSTLVQNTGSELRAFPWDIRASVTLSGGAPLVAALPGSVLMHPWDSRTRNQPITGLLMSQAKGARFRKFDDSGAWESEGLLWYQQIKNE